MASPNPDPCFNGIKALSFDIFGTLIDWESGILTTLTPLIQQLPATHAASVCSATAIAAYDRHERALISSNPNIAYDEALSQAYFALAAEWGVQGTQEGARRLVANVSNWPCFPDTVLAMQRLSRRFKIIALSNFARPGWDLVAAGVLKDVHFDAVYLAQDIGSYKPDHRNFAYLVQHASSDLGVQKAHICHVAHGVASDQVPAEQLGLSHVWIERGVNNWMDTVPSMDTRCYKDLAALADDAVGRDG